MIAAAAKFPGWVKKAQAQLDSVCGSNAERLPSFDVSSKVDTILSQESLLVVQGL
jgi:hypothetical protein